MKAGGWAALFFVALAGVVALLADRAARNERYARDKAAYEEEARRRDQDLARAQAMIADRERKEAAALEEARQAREGRQAAEQELERQRAQGAALAASNQALRTELEPVIAANPKLKALIQGYDLALANKDEQIFSLTKAYKASQDEALANYTAWQEARAQADEWRAQYTDEHALRLQGDTLRLNLEKMYKTSAFWAALGKWGPPAAFCLGVIFGHF